MSVETLTSKEQIIILLAGKNSPLAFNTVIPSEAITEWERRLAIPFDIETSITAGVYIKLREIAEIYFDEISHATKSFSEFDADLIRDNPNYLPLLQHIAGIFSKSKLKEIIGSANDTYISAPAARRLADYLNKRVHPETIKKGEILTRLNSTLEGIVRDLVGRILLESIVVAALEESGLKYQREYEYTYLPGVVYNFRPDFIVPNIDNPMVFIEVRKSSSRHASLYAKDKMFSAINWKGKNKDLLGILVVDGQWTTTTLDVMGRVWDYVIPITEFAKVTPTISAYVLGDRSKLKWIIEFRVIENTGGAL